MSPLFELDEHDLFRLRDKLQDYQSASGGERGRKAIAFLEEVVDLHLLDALDELRQQAKR